jgi:putative transposase
VRHQHTRRAHFHPRWRSTGHGNSKGRLAGSAEQKRALIEPDHPTLSVARQCRLLGLPRSSWYYQPRPPSATTQELLDRLDEQYTRTPFYGTRRMTAWLRSQGYPVNRKRVRRLLQLLGLETIYPKPHTSTPAPGHRLYPYLLRGLPITHADQVWSSDITYIRLRQGWVYLVAILDWYSRYVVAWELSNTLDSAFCIAALERALKHARPTIFNTDQGSQFTSLEFTGRLQAADVRISMDGRGRALDNVFVERLWRTVKYEEVYLKGYETVPMATRGLGAYYRFYNEERLHQALAYRTPAAVYQEGAATRARLG